MDPGLRIVLAVSIAIGLLMPAAVEAARPSPTKDLGARDALLVTDADGRVLLTHNPTLPLVPASTLKVVTALAARHHLGDQARFHTDFLLDPEGNLWIRGYGDPLLVSEVIADIAHALHQRLEAPLNAIVLDDRYFSQPLVIPGVSASTNPYDAPNGALCVNFNTVNFRTRGGRIVSAEPQTPLLPVVMPRIRSSGLRRGRVVLSHHDNEALLYAGALFRYFLEQAGVAVKGPLRLPGNSTPPERLLYRHTSPFSLDEVTARLMEFSNNFIANQLLVAVGARVYGAPGTLAKGARALNAFAADSLGIAEARLVEGSGISRENRISARELMRALVLFEPYRHLMTREANTFFKTGTLKGIRTRVGYIETRDHQLLRFVLLLNSPGKRPQPILKSVEAYLQP